MAVWQIPHSSHIPRDRARHTAAVQVPVTPTEVRAAIIRVISEKKGGVEIISQSDKEYMVDIDRDGARLTGPVAGSAADGKIDRQPQICD